MIQNRFLKNQDVVKFGILLFQTLNFNIERNESRPTGHFWT